MNPFVRGVCNFLGSVSSQQKFEATDQCYSPLTDHVTALGQSSVTAPCYSSVLFRKIKENASSRCEGRPTQKMWRGERERERQRGARKWQRGARKWQRGREAPGPLAPLFIPFFPPPGPAYVNWASCECSLFYLMSSFWSSDLPLFYFLRLSPSLFFSHCHSGLLFLF